MKNQLTTLDNGITKQNTKMEGQNMKNMKMMNAMRMKLFCVATCAMAMTAAHLTAQVFTTLHTFMGGSDGAFPEAGLVLSGNTLYGAALMGGNEDYGTVFALNTDGTGFRLLETFNGAWDAAYPNFLLLSGNTLYGGSGGTGTSGTLFAVSTNGTGFTNLHIFTTISAPHYINSDGAEVWGPLILSGNTLYGAASFGGSGGSGMVFALNTNGTGFKNLHSFAAPSVAFNPFALGIGVVFPPYTNSDGAFPDAGLILSGDTLYGTTGCGGSWGWGTVFAINTNGTGFTNLYSFTGGSDGAFPYAGLILSGNTLYGTAAWGGTNRTGTVFALNTDGTGFTALHVFTATNVPYIWPPRSTTNSDGAWPFASLILSGNTLYGTTQDGGIHGKGTVFAVNADGTGFTNLHSFTGGKDGANPLAALILSGNTLYGTAREGGIYGDGTVFSLSFRPQLTIIPSETNLILTWPTNYAGFDYTGYTLESTTNLVSPVWATNSPAPVVVNGQNIVTNTISGTQQFYRLIQ
jgi:uncharacterized repeat protein (TIGR03803 family)